MVSYVPISGPGVNNVRKHMTSRIDIEPDDIPILHTSEVHADNPGEIDGENILGESMSYSPAFSNFSSPVVKTDRNITDLNKDNPANDSLLKSEENEEDRNLDLSDKDMVQYVPSAIVDYYNESALSTKQRKKLSDDQFGLPRLRAYPLNDQKHVLQAIRMFHHCKDPEDRKTLSKNIFKKVKEFDMEVTVAKNNALYEYAPKQYLQESTSLMPTDGMAVDGLGVPRDKRTKEDIIREHLRVNSTFYNQVFYNNEFVSSIRAIKEFNFLDYFYPNFKSFNLYTRMKTVLGGMGMKKEVFDALGIRFIFEADYSVSLGNVDPGEVEGFDTIFGMNYNPLDNWYAADLSNDPDHALYCLRLYSILGYIINKPDFNIEDLGPYHLGILTDWNQKVIYHYDLMQDEKLYSKEYIKQCQYLHDLCWSPADNPMSEDIVASCVISMVQNMAVTEKLVTSMNENRSLFTKEDCKAYLIKELGYEDDLFLLPSTLEYPIINKDSVRLAMDIIRKIEPDQVDEYVTNLNRKYRELGCTFRISIDHPYAQYADKVIVDNMLRILAEAGATGFSDQGTSVSTTASVEAGPWYQSLNHFEGMASDFFPDRNLGPNTKKNKQDVSRHDSIM